MACRVRVYAGNLSTVEFQIDGPKPPNKAWEVIKRNHRGERDVAALVALREMLCRKVDADTMTVQETTEQFEAKRPRVIRERREHNWQQGAGNIDIG